MNLGCQITKQNTSITTKYNWTNLILVVNFILPYVITHFNSAATLICEDTVCRWGWYHTQLHAVHPTVHNQISFPRQALQISENKTYCMLMWPTSNTHIYMNYTQNNSCLPILANWNCGTPLTIYFNKRINSMACYALQFWTIISF